MKKILDRIIAHKKVELTERRRLVGIESLKRAAYFERTTQSLQQSLQNKQKTGIIAEFKRRSPSKGIINQHASVTSVVSAYEYWGASGVSILTDNLFFGGSDTDILRVRERTQLPILRKEFIIDEYQLYESKALGADCILLIASVLTPKEVLSLARIAHDLGLEVLLELHAASEVNHLNEYIDMVGINNRNLQTFEVDLAHSSNLLHQLPTSLLRIAESGIQSKQEMDALQLKGFDGFLIGEHFMKAASPEEAFRRFVSSSS